MAIKKDKKKLNILVVYAAKFGFHVVSYYLSKYASKEHNVTYLGLVLDDTGNSLKFPGVNVIEHECTPGIKGRLNMLKKLKKQVLENSYDVIFTQYFAGLSLLTPFFKKQNIVVDIRSGYLLDSPVKRKALNLLLSNECKFFSKNISINSIALGKYLGFREHDLKELPLGADQISFQGKTFEKIKLIYLGTLHKRNIHIAIEGLAKYIGMNPDHKIESFDIIGSGNNHDEDLIKNVIQGYDLGHIVKMHGYISRQQVSPYLQNANVGVSFVPKTLYYDLQPVTKTYEFLLSGIPIIATSTSQNSLIINSKNGVLIEDDIDGFYQGIKFISSNLSTYDSECIYNESKKHSWERVINEKYLPYLISVCED